MKFFRGLIHGGILAILCWVVLFCVVAAFTCSCTTRYVLVTPQRYESSEYYTYAGEPFKRTHFGTALRDTIVDIVHVNSVTVKPGVVIARIVESDFPIEIRYPDRLEAVNGVETR